MATASPEGFFLTSRRNGRIGLIVAVFVVAMLHASACSASCFMEQVQPVVPASADPLCHFGGDSMPSSPSNSQPSGGQCQHPGHRDAFLKSSSLPELKLHSFFSQSFFIVRPAFVSWPILFTRWAEVILILPGASARPLYEKFSLLRI